MRRTGPAGLCAAIVLGMMLLVAPAGCGLLVQRIPAETILHSAGVAAVGAEGGGEGGGASAEGGEVVLPTFRCADTYLLRAEINGRGPFYLLIDTGAAMSALTPEAAARLSEWEGRTWFPMVGATGRRVDASRKVRVESLRAGGFELRGMDAVVVALDGFGAALGGELDGVIGYPAFRGVLLTFDYPRGEVRVGRGTLAEGPHSERLHHRFAPLMRLDVQGATKRVVIDTGSSGSLSIPGAGAMEYIVPPRVVGSVLALGGTELRAEGRLEGDIELGGHTLREPIVDSSKVLSLLGSDIMRFFTVRIDQERRLAEFTRDGGGPVIFPGTFGIGVGGVPEAGGYRVTDVLEGLPAERAGLLPGDLIETVDGRRVTDLFCDRHALYTAPGVAHLGILRGGERLTIPTEVVALVP